MTQPAPQQLHLHQSGHVHDSGCAHHGAGADGGDSCHCGAASGEVDAANDRIALAGAPNAGKTSIYNALTGLRAKTGNYPGVTVTRAVGTCRLSGGRGTEAGSDGPEAVTIEDLPGA